MDHLSIDIETRSSADISKTGAYRYAQDDDFEILLIAYKYNDEEKVIIDVKQGEVVPEYFVSWLTDKNIIKHAYNAAFEWYCFNQAGLRTPIDQWQCDMIHGLYCGYPGGLAKIGDAIGLSEDKKKMSVGKALIRYFCVPQRATKKNGGRKYNDPKHDLEKWALFKEYCLQDVETEWQIEKRLSLYPVPESEWHQWRMDVLMNAYGVRADVPVIKGALAINAQVTDRLTREAMLLTHLENPNSTSQLLVWLSDHGVDTPNLQKETVKELLKCNLSDDVRRVLEIRQQLGKTSIKKYVAMETALCRDERIRGLTQFYGANRTGRWAGRLVQLQNLPRNYLKTLDFARELTKKSKTEMLEIVYGDVQDTLSQLIRTAFIPSEERKFVVADFSAIEARVIAWLAGEEWVNEVFATHGKIYEATASQMFHVPIEKIKKGNPEYSLRQKGKVATLALGYQGGVNALIAMGALKMGLDESELPDIVSRWRQANPRIKDLWGKVENAAITAYRTAQPQAINNLIFSMESDLIYGQTFLTVQLPSRRKLYYPKPFLQVNDLGRDALHFYGTNQTTGKWGIVSTYGGKLTENIVQAVARDCLAVTLDRINRLGFQVVFHVHDEVIVDAPMDLSVDTICDLMAEPIPWAPGLILKGAGFESQYYMKD